MNRPDAKVARDLRVEEPGAELVDLARRGDSLVVEREALEAIASTHVAQVLSYS